jgi:hypothetical protein
MLKSAKRRAPSTIDRELNTIKYERDCRWLLDNIKGRKDSNCRSLRSLPYDRSTDTSARIIPVEL